MLSAKKLSAAQTGHQSAFCKRKCISLLFSEMIRGNRNKPELSQSLLSAWIFALLTIFVLFAAEGGDPMNRGPLILLAVAMYHWPLVLLGAAAGFAIGTQTPRQQIHFFTADEQPLYARH